jgi:hypothetical protein
MLRNIICSAVQSTTHQPEQLSDISQSVRHRPETNLPSNIAERLSDVNPEELAQYPGRLTMQTTVIWCHRGDRSQPVAL